MRRRCLVVTQEVRKPFRTPVMTVGFQLRTNQAIHGVQGPGESVWVSPAGLRHVWAATATAAHHARDFTDEVARVNLLPSDVF